METLTYKVSPQMAPSIKEGSYVKVPLRNNILEGIVLRTFEDKPPYPTKEIGDLIHDNPLLQTWQLKLAKWMAQYYKCPLQKAIQLFLPPKLYETSKLDIPKDDKRELRDKHKLNDEQKAALKSIIETKKTISLVHGITGSGKTELYLHLINKYIEIGKQSILVVPEISLTPQMIQYFERVFGNNVAILHSKLTEKQRSLQWLKIFLTDTPIIIGPRSAVFAPAKNLGLIIMDEEHEFSYKQEQSPRYHTKKVIEKAAELLDLKIVLGSATPSVSSYYRAKKGQYNLTVLKKRIGDINLPTNYIVDLREEFQKRNYSVLSDLLQEKITASLAQNKQTILFLNKRGSASAVICRDCGYIEKCSACDVSLTYHSIIPETLTRKPTLICHHCGLIKDIPSRCPECKSTSIKYVGAGTQKVEQEVKEMFPNARVARVDKDTTASRNAFEEIYNKLKNREIDIVIGTQMIGKGLHLPNVNLVGVILADIGLHFPDFRSSERTFQLLTQVAGRAGRSDTPGEVVIQTYMPDNIAIKFAKDHDFLNFYEYEIKQRETFKYPPFSKLIKLTFVDENANKAQSDAKTTYENLKTDAEKANIQCNLFPSLIFKLHNKFRWNILLHGENPNAILKDFKLPDSCRVDVDPISTS